MTGCFPEGRTREHSPIDALESGDEIEVPVSAQERKRILTAERGNPRIIGGNGLAFPFQSHANALILKSSFHGHPTAAF